MGTKRKAKVKVKSRSKVARNTKTQAAPQKQDAFQPGTFLVKKSDGEIPVQCASAAAVDVLVRAHGEANVRRAS